MDSNKSVYDQIKGGSNGHDTPSSENTEGSYLPHKQQQNLQPNTAHSDRAAEKGSVGLEMNNSMFIGNTHILFSVCQMISTLLSMKRFHAVLVYQHDSATWFLLSPIGQPMVWKIEQFPASLVRKQTLAHWLVQCESRYPSLSIYPSIYTHSSLNHSLVQTLKLFTNKK